MASAEEQEVYDHLQTLRPEAEHWTSVVRASARGLLAVLAPKQGNRLQDRQPSEKLFGFSH